MNIHLSTGSVTAVSFDEGSQTAQRRPGDYNFNDILPLHDDEMEEAESVAGGYLDPGVNLISLDWEIAPPISLLPECFFDIDTANDAFVAGTLDPTEVSESEDDSDQGMDCDSSSLEHRFEQTAKKLAESMEKSRRTRVSLSLKPPAVAHYFERRTSISSVVSSVEESSQQLLTTFRTRGSPSPLSDL